MTLVLRPGKRQKLVPDPNPTPEPVQILEDWLICRCAFVGSAQHNLWVYKKLRCLNKAIRRFVRIKMMRKYPSCCGENHIGQIRSIILRGPGCYKQRNILTLGDAIAPLESAWYRFICSKKIPVYCDCDSLATLIDIRDGVKAWVCGYKVASGSYVMRCDTLQYACPCEESTPSPFYTGSKWTNDSFCSLQLGNEERVHYYRKPEPEPDPYPAAVDPDWSFDEEGSNDDSNPQ